MLKNNLLVKRNNISFLDYNCACFEAVCGNKEKSLNILKTLLAQEKVSSNWILADPDLEILKDDPKFKDLLNCVSRDSK